MLANSSGVQKEKKKSLVKIGIFTSCRGVNANKCTKKGDAGASSKPIPFLQFSLPSSSSSLLKLPNFSNSTNLVSRAFPSIF